MQDSPLRSWRAVGGLLLVLLLCTATMFANPIGLELQRTWFRIVGSAAMARNVAEHSPLSLAREGDQAVVAFAVFYAALVGTVHPRRWRVTWLLPVVWFALTLNGIRQGPLFVMVGVVVAADVWPHTLWYEKLRQSGDSLTRSPQSLPPFRLRGLAVPAAAVSVALVLQAAGVRVPVVGRGWAELDSPAMPMDLVEPLQAVAAELPPGTPIYNDLNFGGFVIYFAPTLKVFGDDRFELCGDAWLDAYVDTVFDHPERFDDWQRQYNFTTALVAPGALEDHLARSGRWERVAQGRRAALYRLRP